MNCRHCDKHDSVVITGRAQRCFNERNGHYEEFEVRCRNCGGLAWTRDDQARYTQRKAYSEQEE